MKKNKDIDNINLNEERRNLAALCYEVLTILVSAFILSLSFPGFMSRMGFGFIALFALIPVLIVIRNTSWRLVWCYGFIFGLTYYFFFNYWLSGFHPLAILIAPIIKGGEMLILFLVLKAAITLFPNYSFVLEALIWVSYAYLAENWFAGYPYGNIGYALWRYPILTQITDITGVWGLIFMMVVPEAFFAEYFYKIIKKKKVSFFSYSRKHIVLIIIYLVLLISQIIYGGVKLSYWKDREADRLWRVGAVQHNHDSWKGGYRTYNQNFNNLRRYTLEAVKMDPDIVIWSETAFVPSVSWHLNYFKEGSGWEDIAYLTRDFVEFGNNLGVPLLTGNPKGVISDESKEAYDEEGNQNRKDYNSVLLFYDGDIQGEYLKQQLVPFTEHFPYEKQLPWLYNLLLKNDYNWWEKGDESVVFDLNGVKFSTPICYEDAFSRIPASFVKNGADVIVNMTNDNWSKKASAEWQHAIIATYRSIETRKATVRGTNSGITCMITPTGKVVEPMIPFEMGYHLYEVPVYTHESYKDTFYVRHIDLFAYIAIILSLVLLSFGLVYRVVEIIIFKRRKNK